MFYEALEKASGELEIDLRNVIEGFVNQKTNSVVMVNKFENGILRFVKKPISMPYNIITSSMETPSEIKWLSENHNEILSIPTLNDDDWYLMNIDQFGFYRVNYDIGNWRAIINALQNNPQVFSSKTKAQLIDDSLNLAKDSFLSYNIALDLLMDLEVETSFLPWNVAMKNLLYLNNFLAETDVHQEFQVSVVVVVIFFQIFLTISFFLHFI